MPSQATNIAWAMAGSSVLRMLCAMTVICIALIAIYFAIQGMQVTLPKDTKQPDDDLVSRICFSVVLLVTSVAVAVMTLRAIY